MNPKENDNEIIELSDKELDEIFTDDDFDNGEGDGKIRSFYFSNPDPYAKVRVLAGAFAVQFRPIPAPGQDALAVQHGGDFAIGHAAAP